jgi:IS30 family transposase
MPNHTQDTGTTRIQEGNNNRGSQLKICRSWRTIQDARKIETRLLKATHGQRHQGTHKPCQTTTDKGKPPDGSITGLPITSGPSQRINADLFGPLQNSERGNMYILVITNAFTKMAQLTPLNGKDAATVTKAMMDNMYTFGVPHTVVTDQGPEFVSQMQNILFDSLNIDRKVTTGYHSRCNGAAEQFNKIMVSDIKAQMQQQGKSTLD